MDVPLTVEDNRQRSFTKGAEIVILVTCATLIAVAFWFSTRLRPFGDDYCNAAGASQGLAGYVFGLYQSWGGDLVGTAQIFFTVGFPILHFAWPVASAVNFVLASLLIFLFGILATRFLMNVTLYRACVIAITFPVAWWIFLWIPSILKLGDPQLLSRESVASLFLYQTVHWYVISSFAILLLAVALTRVPRSKRRLASALWFIFGLWTSLSFLTAGFSILGISLLILAWRSIKPGPSKSDPGFSALGALAGSSFGLAISLLSPGAANRRTYFSPEAPSDLSLNGVFWWVTVPVPEALAVWLESILNPGFVAVVALAFVIASVLSLYESWAQARFGFRTSALLLFFGLINAVITRVGEGFSYGAIHHYVPMEVLVFASALALGFGLASLPCREFPLPRLLSAVATGLILISLGMASVATMGAAITERWLRWEVGSAPIAGFGDDLEGYSLDCWNNLGTLRSLPPRVQT